MTFFASERCVSAICGLIPLLFKGVEGGDVADAVLRNVLVALSLGLPVVFKRFGWHRLGTVNIGSVIFMTVYSAFSTVAAISCIAFKSSFGRESVIFALIVMIGFIGTEFLGHWLVYHLQVTNAENLELLYINHERESNEELLSLT